MTSLTLLELPTCVIDKILNELPCDAPAFRGIASSCSFFRQWLGCKFCYRNGCVHPDIHRKTLVLQSQPVLRWVITQASKTGKYHTRLHVMGYIHALSEVGDALHALELHKIPPSIELMEAAIMASSCATADALADMGVKGTHELVRIALRGMSNDKGIRLLRTALRVMQVSTGREKTTARLLVHEAIAMLIPCSEFICILIKSPKICLEELDVKTLLRFALARGDKRVYRACITQWSHKRIDRPPYSLFDRDMQRRVITLHWERESIDLMELDVELWLWGLAYTFKLGACNMFQRYYQLHLKHETYPCTIIYQALERSERICDHCANMFVGDGRFQRSMCFPESVDVIALFVAKRFTKTLLTLFSKGFLTQAEAAMAVNALAKIELWHTDTDQFVSAVVQSSWFHLSTDLAKNLFFRAIKTENPLLASDKVVTTVFSSNPGGL